LLRVARAPRAWQSGIVSAAHATLACANGIASARSIAANRAWRNRQHHPAATPQHVASLHARGIGAPYRHDRVNGWHAAKQRIKLWRAIGAWCRRSWAARGAGIENGAHAAAISDGGGSRAHHRALGMARVSSVSASISK